MLTVEPVTVWGGKSHMRRHVLLLRLVLLLPLVLLLAACGGGERETMTIYLKARLGPEGPHSQIAPVLAPFERERRSQMSAAWQAILEIRVGPSPNERGRGVLDTLDPETRLRSVRVRDGVAIVDLAGKEPDFYAVAALVYSLTEADNINRVRLNLNGRPCCKYRHDGSVVAVVSRRSYAGWQGEPCAARAETSAPCRG
jgi:hypothetical protein